MNLYEAIVMSFFAISAIILAVCNYNAQTRAAADSKKIAHLSAENEKLRAENNRLKFGRQIETFFMSVAGGSEKHNKR